jgi:hypothetical protein
MPDNTPPQEADFPSQLAWSQAQAAYEAQQAAGADQSAAPPADAPAVGAGPAAPAGNASAQPQQPDPLQSLMRQLDSVRTAGYPFGGSNSPHPLDPGNDWRTPTAPLATAAASAAPTPRAAGGVLGRIEGLMTGTPQAAPAAATQSNPLKVQTPASPGQPPQAPINNLIYALRHTNPNTAYSRIPLPPGFKGFMGF